MNRIVVILWVLIVTTFASEEKGVELEANLLAEKKDVTESQSTETKIKIYEENNKEIEKNCFFCYKELNEMNKVFRLDDSQYTNGEQVFHLLHAKNICENCMTDWLAKSNGDCPYCKKLLILDTSSAATIWALRICYARGKLTYDGISLIVSIPNILIPGYLSFPHGLTTILMGDMLHEIFTEPAAYYNYVSNLAKFKLILWQTIPPLITNVVYLFQDSLNLTTVTGEELIDASGEYVVIPKWQTAFMIGVPLFVKFLKFSPKRNILGRITKLIDYANYGLPFLTTQQAIFPILYFSAFFSTSRRRQESHWLLFLANILVLILYPIGYTFDSPHLATVAKAYAIIVFLAVLMVRHSPVYAY